MEPIHIHAMLHGNVAEEAFREQLEQHFAVRTEAKARRRERLRLLRESLSGRPAPLPTPRPAL